MWVKICGLTDPMIAAEVAQVMPDAIGLNFYAKSPRLVSLPAAAEIVAALPATVTPVGVFVNSPRDEILSICQHTGLRTIQLHGDESPEFLSELSSYQLIRAFRVAEEGLTSVAEYLERCQELDVSLKACLIDARVSGAYGGTGQVAPWDILKEWDRTSWPPLILAGGLTPENIDEAIATVQPNGVDVASGVEVTPGRQSLDRVRQFIARCRQPHC